MKIKFTILLLIVGFMSFQAVAQQDPQFTQFMNNKLFYNPGFAGSTPDKICVNGTFRTQWVGYGGGVAFTPEIAGAKAVEAGNSPSTQNFGIHGNYKRIGLGLNIWNDQLGFSNTLAPTLSLAYIHPFSNGARLSGGIGVGIVQKGIDGSKLVAIDPGDQLIPTGDVKGNKLNLDFGVYYTMPQLSIFNDFYFGASALHINNPVVDFSQGSYNGTAKQVNHFYLMTGGVYNLNANIDINVNMLYKTDMAKSSFDLNALAVFQQKLIGGLSYRTPQEFSILAGYNFFANAPNPLQLMYSYDLITSDVLKYSSGSHELTLRYCFGLKIKTTPPTIIRLKNTRKL
ncbi:MAG: type IX secretion system membrane protein PorP/SprF [Bacteroidia bacterium]|nr:type IX secretion system membrane protein PorP/SprF [Bacteroidia bacterium]